MSTKFFTNSDNNTLLQKLTGVFESNENITLFDIVTGYFRASGYFSVMPYLERLKHIRIIVGMELDNLTYYMNTQGTTLTKLTHQNVVSFWQEEHLLADIQSNAHYGGKYENAIKQFIKDIQDQKIVLRVHPSKRLHSKIYIFYPEGFNQHKYGSVITGSSNFTQYGIGSAPNSNYEFNVQLNDYDDVRFAIDEFEKLWQESVEVTPADVADVESRSYLAKKSITPYELYLKFLIEYFSHQVEFDPNSITDLPRGVLRLDFQLDAVNQGLDLLHKHNGFFLSDVVGLGKTIIATLIARELVQTTSKRAYILIVAPPSLQNTWKNEIKRFKMETTTDFISSGSLHKLTPNSKKYSIVIVDEAHKFRNDTSKGYSHLQAICKTPFEGKAKKVLLVTATPLNNRPNDLFNQLLLFTDGYNIESYRKEINNCYKDIVDNYKLQDDISINSLLTLPIISDTLPIKTPQELYQDIRDKIITQYMIRRTRSDLTTSKRYLNDLKKQGVNFPKVNPPISVFYNLNTDLKELYERSVKSIRQGLTYVRYSMRDYLKSEQERKLYGSLAYARPLVGIMKSLLLKRMDSSFYAFRCTLDSFFKGIKKVRDMIDNNAITIDTTHDLPQSEELNDELNEELIPTNAQTRQSKTYSTDDFKSEFFNKVEKDYILLRELINQWNNLTQDPKVEKCLSLMPKLLNKQQNPQQKVIIFSESADTATYLYEQFRDRFKTLMVTSANRREKSPVVSSNFDAAIPQAQQRNDYQVLITTDVLAEGVNLHRSNTVLNYDTHWNSTKLLQRIGRVNRIPSSLKNIFIYNFYPPEEINEELKLIQVAEIKLQSLHSTLGEDSQVYSSDEVVESFALYDDKSKVKTDPTLPFLEEIRQFRENKPDEYNRIKNSPNKIRNAVRYPRYAGQTLTFIRNNNQSSRRFYMVSADNDVKEVSFITAVNLLKEASAKRPATVDSKLHSQQVNAAKHQFLSDIRTQEIKQSQFATSLSPSELSAIRFIQVIGRQTDNQQQKEKLQMIANYIKDKKYRRLHIEINKTRDEVKNQPLNTREKAQAILNRFEKDYSYTQQVEPSAKTQTRSEDITVIISQSYVQ